MSENGSSNRFPKAIAIAFVVIFALTVVFGIWFVSWSKAEFEEMYGFHPDNRKSPAVPQKTVDDELLRRCKAYLQAHAERESINWPAWTLGADLSVESMEGVLGEFNAETKKAEEAISRAELAFIHARVFAEDYGFEVRVPACDDLRQPQMGIPR